MYLFVYAYVLFQQASQDSTRNIGSKTADYMLLNGSFKSWQSLRRRH